MSACPLAKTLYNYYKSKNFVGSMVVQEHNNSTYTTTLYGPSWPVSSWVAVEVGTGSLHRSDKYRILDYTVGTNV